MHPTRSHRFLFGLIAALAMPAAQAGHYVLVKKGIIQIPGTRYLDLCPDLVKTLNNMKPVRPMVCGFDVPDGTGPVTTPHWHRIDPKAHMGILRKIAAVRDKHVSKKHRNEGWQENKQLIEAGKAQLWRARFDLNNKPGKETVLRHDLWNCHPDGAAERDGARLYGTAVVADSGTKLDHAYWRLHERPSFEPFFYAGRTWLWKWWGNFGHTPAMVYEEGSSLGEFGWSSDAVCRIDYVAQEQGN